MEEEKNIGQIRSKFDELETINDFVDLINFTSSFLFPTARFHVSKSKISYYAFHADNRYRTFEISKKSGGMRTITAPVIPLKIIQSCLNVILQSKFNSHHASHGFLSNRNIVSNAQRHTSKMFVLNVDIENFFPSVEFRRIKTVLELPPFSLNKKREPIAFLIANLCTENGVLPQGAPTSPILTNIVCQRLDRKLFALSKEMKCTYSRYADDITFSSNEELTFLNVDRIDKVIQNEGFVLKISKTRIQEYTNKQEVTGLVVNKKVNVSRKYIRSVKAVLFNFENHGYDYTQSRFNSFWNKSTVKPPPFELSILGRIHFIGMVRGKKDYVYRSLLDRYNNLFNSNYIDFSHVKLRAVREQLESDNKKMEEIKHKKYNSEEDQFIDFCVSAFHQIEELINYYLTCKYTMEELIDEIVEHTTTSRGSLNGKKHVGEINVVTTLFIFEKDLFFKPGVFYKSVLTSLRIIRNWALHRNNSHPRIDKDVLNRYDEIQQLKKRHLAENNEYIKLNWWQRKFENEGDALKFMKMKDFVSVRKAIESASQSVKLALKDE